MKHPFIVEVDSTEDMSFDDLLQKNSYDIDYDQVYSSIDVYEVV